MDAGMTVSGFPPNQADTLRHMVPGDVLLCYVRGMKRWIGALEVVGPTSDDRRIWSEAQFPARVAVQPLTTLSFETGVPVEDIIGHVSLYRTAAEVQRWNAFTRTSPRRFKNQPDGEYVFNLIRTAKEHPTVLPVDAKSLAARVRLYSSPADPSGRQRPHVTVPDGPVEQVQVPASSGHPDPADVDHTSIQHLLIAAGAEMGYKVWVARNDRSRTHEKDVLGQMPGVIDTLPTPFQAAVRQTIELIDVLWLKGNAIAAAFEIEHTSAVYSGLLRMSDLLALQPNLDVKLYIVAPDDRREKVESEVRRPTFSLRDDRPMGAICGLLAYSRLRTKLSELRRLGLMRHISADVLEDWCEHFT